MLHELRATRCPTRAGCKLNSVHSRVHFLLRMPTVALFRSLRRLKDTAPGEA